MHVTTTFSFEGYRITEYKGIVPVNALNELKALARQPWHYHSPLPAGRGVLDGLRHFGFSKDLT